MSEHQYHLESFRNNLAKLIEVTRNAGIISPTNIVRTLLEATTCEMQACLARLDDPRDVEQVRKLFEAAMREIEDAISGKASMML